MQPFLRYVLVGWRAKRNDIMDAFTPNARVTYFRMFDCCHSPPGLEQAPEAFERLYTLWYGRRYFLIPGVLLLAFALTATSAAVFSALGPDLYAPNPLFKLPATAIAALSGAYLWVVNDLIGRARRLDFSPADIMWAVLRLVIAVPMGYAFSALFTERIAPFVAFGFGAFPLSGLLSIMRRLTEKQLESTSQSAEAVSDDLIKLQGINKPILERLSNEDITTVTQIAYCDPVRLAMRSNLSFNFIVDCMNQALAWLYLSEQLNIIRPFGLRGAVEIKCLMNDHETIGETQEEKDAHAKAIVLMQQIAPKLDTTSERLEFAFFQIAYDPFTVFLYQMWQLTEVTGDEGARRDGEVSEKSDLEPAR